MIINEYDLTAFIDQMEVYVLLHKVFLMAFRNKNTIVVRIYKILIEIFQKK